MTDIIPFTPSQQLADAFPEISQITIYGSTEEPLFPIAQVQTMIGSDRIQLDKCGYKLEIDYVKLVCARKDGRATEQNLLTEQGLYKLLMRTDTPVSEKFQAFVKVVMRELRLRGQVTIGTAVQELQKVLDQRNEQLEIEHTEKLQYKRESERFYLQKMNAIERAAVAEMRLKQAREAPNNSPEYIIERLKERYMKRVYVYLAKPPKEIEEEFAPLDELDPTDDEEICVEISFKSRELRSSIAEIFTHRDIRLATLQDKFRDRFAITIEDGGLHQSKFRCSIDDIRALELDLI